jgi:hypothetical protein
VKTIIKCNPGWLLVAEYFPLPEEPNHPGFYTTPIIAWEIDTRERVTEYRRGDGCYVTRPITVDGLAPDNTTWAIQRPDGVVECTITQEVFESAEAFKAVVLSLFEEEDDNAP